MLILSLIASLDSLPTLIWWYQIFFFKRKSNLLCCWLIPWVHCYIYLNWHYSFISFFFILLKHQLLSSLLCTLSLPAALQCIQPSFGGRVEKGREFGREGRRGGGGVWSWWFKQMLHKIDLYIFVASCQMNYYFTFFFSHDGLPLTSMSKGEVWLGYMVIDHW